MSSDIEKGDQAINDSKLSDQCQSQQLLFKRLWRLGLVMLGIVAIYFVIACRLMIWPFESRGGPSKNPDFNQAQASDIGYEVIYKTSFGFIDEKKGFVVKSQSELEELWPNIIPMSGNNPLPQVDFSKERVAVVSLGEYSACNKLKISRIYQSGDKVTGDKVTIEYTITSPEGLCPCTLDRKLLLEMVKYSSSEDDIGFEEKMATEECWDKK